jgi:hypothetical protein
MRKVALLGFALLMALSAGPAWADKVELNEKDWSYDPYTVRQIWAEQEPLNNTCPGQAIACGDVVDNAQINPGGDLDWYSFNVAVAGTWLTIGTDTPTMGGSCDTYLELYDVCGGTRLAYDDDSGPGSYSLISNYVTTHSGTFIVKCRGYSGTTTGNYKLFVTCIEPVPPPPNDRCEGAIPIERCTAGSLNGDLTYATNDYDPGVGTPPPSCTGFTAAGKDVVYVLNLMGGDVCHFDYVKPTTDASFYLVTDCANVNDSCLIGADDTVTGGHEIIDWTAPSAGTYYLILDGYGTNTGGTWTLTYEITCPSPRVCCLDEACYLVMEPECAAMGGVFHPEWSSCGPPNPCALPHVCCVGEECYVVFEADCTAMGGEFHPGWDSCGPPNPCASTPATPDTWGGVKNLYR